MKLRQSHQQDGGLKNIFSQHSFKMKPENGSLDSPHPRDRVQSFVGCYINTQHKKRGLK